MGLFSRKKTVDVTQQFKDTYKYVNEVLRDANNELDFEVKLSLLKLANEKYDQLMDYIDKGADYDRNHFEKLKESNSQKIKELEGILSDEN